MIVHNVDQAAQVSGIKSSSFGFRSSAKMFDILINKMYTNKPGAVIRELSANAWDAHVEAGNSDVPFDLQLPTWLDKTFSIRDYGTGIPHESFEEIYTNIGASTKEGSNDFIGSFGLGSKVSFTMTDTFMVENWNSGTKTTWICFKDKGEPQVSKVSEEPSDEPSGLKVSFSFDEGDVPEFTKQVSKQLRFFPVKPNIAGGEGQVRFLELPNGWETQDYFYTSGNDRYSLAENYLVMGNVAYSLNSSEFDYSLRPLFNKGLTIKAPIGAVDIPPSRENLEMTPRTKAYIISVLGRIKQDYARDTQVKINACSTKWELRKVLFDINYSLIGNLDALTWNKAFIDWTQYRQSYVSQIAGYSTKGIHSRYKNVYRSSPLNIRSAIDGTVDYYVNDLGQGFSKHINQEFRNHDVSRMIIFNIDGLVEKTKGAQAAAAQTTLEKELGKKPLLLSSIFGFPVKAVKGATGTKVATNQVFKMKDLIIYSGISMKNQMTEESDMPTNGYYVELKLWTLQTSVGRLRDILESGLLNFLDKPLYAVRSKTIPKLDKSMVLLDSSVLQGLKDAIVAKHKEIEQSRFVLSRVHSIPEVHRLLLPAIKDKQVKAYARYSSYVKKKTDNFLGNTDQLYRLIFKSNIDFVCELSPKLKGLHAKYEPIHEVLSAMCCSYDKKRNEKRIKTISTLITDNQ